MTHAADTALPRSDRTSFAANEDDKKLLRLLRSKLEIERGCSVSLSETIREGLRLLAEKYNVETLGN